MDKKSKTSAKTDETMMDVNVHFDASDVLWHDSLLLNNVRDKQPKKKEK